MKIRGDFVTNSSSVSYIITMHPAMVGIDEASLGAYWTESRVHVQSVLREKLLGDGTRVMIEDEELYTHKLEFQTDETMTAETYGRPHEEIELAALPDQEVWAYICGEYFLEGRITELRGFGATQVKTY